MYGNQACTGKTHQTMSVHVVSDYYGSVHEKHTQMRAMFSISCFCLSSNHQLEATLHPFFLCETRHAAALSVCVCVFGCLSAQRETDAVFASSRDKGTSMITISESESEGDLITPPTSRHDRLPSV